MQSLKLLVRVILACLPCACANNLGSMSNAKAAVLVGADITCTQQLNSAVASLIGHPAQLADDAFRQSSTLIVERKRLTTSDGQRVQGRDLEIPQKLNLLIHTDTCVVKHELSGKFAQLQSCTCKPADL